MSAPHASLAVAVALLAGCSQPERTPPPVGNNMTGVGMAARTGGSLATATTASSTGGTSTSTTTDTAPTTDPTSTTAGTNSTTGTDTGLPPFPTAGDPTGSSVPTTGKELPEPTAG